MYSGIKTSFLLKIGIVGVELRVALGDGRLAVTGLADVVTLELDITSLAKEKTGRVHANKGENLHIIVIDCLDRTIGRLLHLNLARTGLIKCTRHAQGAVKIPLADLGRAEALATPDYDFALECAWKMR